jgi:DNA-binding NarL/FixJ family response regulator
VLLDRAPDITVVGEADQGDAALALIADLHPDVVVLDCQLPGMDGVTVAARLRHLEPPVRIVALSAYDDDRYLAGMAEAGALAYLLKNEAPAKSWRQCGRRCAASRCGHRSSARALPVGVRKSPACATA